MLFALIGLLLTVVWLIGGTWYIAVYVGFENLLLLLPSELGEFLTGFLLPLTLLWLVLGFLHVGQRLRRLEEVFWELAAMGLARGNGNAQGSPDGGSWLDAEPTETSPVAPPTASGQSLGRSRHAATVARPDGGNGPQPSRAEPARRGGLATEVFTTRMRDRVASGYGSTGRGQGAAPAQPSRSGWPPAAQPVAPPPAASRPAPQAAPRAGTAAASVPDPASGPGSASPDGLAVQTAGREAPPAVTPQDGQVPAETAAVPPDERNERAAIDAPAEAAPPSPAERAEPSSAPAATAKPIGFRHLVRITAMELNRIAMDLSAVLCRESEHAQALKGYDKGAKDVFFELVSEQLAKQDPAEAAQRLESRGGGPLVESYLRKFEALLAESKGIDRSGALAKSLEAMPTGRLHGRLQALQAATGRAVTAGGAARQRTR